MSDSSSTATAAAAAAACGHQLVPIPTMASHSAPPVSNPFLDGNSFIDQSSSPDQPSSSSSSASAADDLTIASPTIEPTDSLNSFLPPSTQLDEKNMSDLAEPFLDDVDEPLSSELEKSESPPVPLPVVADIPHVTRLSRAESATLRPQTPPRMKSLPHTQSANEGLSYTFVSSASPPVASPVQPSSVNGSPSNASPMITPSKNGKLKQSLVNLKDRAKAKWSNMKLFKKKVDPISAAASAASSNQSTLPVPSATSAAAGPIMITPPRQANDPQVDMDESGLSSDASVSLPLPEYLSTVPPPLAALAELHSTLQPNQAPAPPPLDAKLSKELQKDLDRQRKQAAKEVALAEKMRLDAEKAAKKEADRLEKEAKKREEKLFKDRAKQALEQKKADEKREAEWKKEQMKSAQKATKAGAPMDHLSVSTVDLHSMHEDPSGSLSATSPSRQPPRAIELLSFQERRDSANGLLPGFSMLPSAALDSSSSPPALMSESPPTITTASSSTGGGSQRVGLIRLNILQGRHMNGKEDQNKQKTCVEVNYNGMTFKSEFVAGSNPYWNLRLTLPIYDITTDIVLHFILKHSLKKNEYFGMVVIPLTTILNRQKLWYPQHQIEVDTTNADTFALDEEQSKNAIISPTQASPSTSSTSSSSSSSVVASSSPSLSAPTFTERASALFTSLFSKRDFTFHEWLQIYPYTFDKAGTLWMYRFPAAEDTILQSGMERPKKELGRVQVAVDVQLEQPLSYGYMEVDPRQYDLDQSTTVPSAGSPNLPALPSPAVSTATHPLFIRPEEPTEFHKTVLKKNVKRIRRWLSVPHWFWTFCTIFSWKIPILTFYFMALWIYLCFYMPAYQYPIFLLLSCFLTNAWIVRWNLEDYSFIRTYQQDAAPSNYLGEGWSKKFQRYRGVLAKMSHYVGKVSSILEKISNLLNFTDLILSIFTYLILGIFAVLLSILLFIIPLNKCIFAIGMYFFIRGGLDTLHEYLQLNYPDIHAIFQTTQPNTSKSGAAAASTLISVPSVGVRLTNKAIESPSSPISTTGWKSRLKSLLQSFKSCLTWFVRILKFLIRCLRYLYRRSPDYYELAHRVLCERAIATSSMCQTITPTMHARKLLFGSNTNVPTAAPTATPVPATSTSALSHMSIRPGLNPSHHLSHTFLRRPSEELSVQSSTRSAPSAISSSSNAAAANSLTLPSLPPAAFGRNASTESQSSQPSSSNHPPRLLHANSASDYSFEESKTSSKGDEDEVDEDENDDSSDEIDTIDSSGTRQRKGNEPTSPPASKVQWY